MQRTTTPRARALRNAATPPERKLWHFLKTLRQEGHYFRRQSPFQGYFLDFVCHAHRLVIEVDGNHHGSPQQAAHDSIRDSVLTRAGFPTLRIQAIDIMQNLEAVTIIIRQALSTHPVLPTKAPRPPNTLKLNNK